MSGAFTRFFAERHNLPEGRFHRSGEPFEDGVVRMLEAVAEFMDTQTTKPPVTVFGLSLAQIAWLRADYMARGGDLNAIPTTPTTPAAPAKPDQTGEGR